MAHDKETIMSIEDLRKNVISFLKNMVEELESETPMVTAEMTFEPEAYERRIKKANEFLLDMEFTGYIDLTLKMRLFDKDVETYQLINRLFKDWDKEGKYDADA